MTSVTVSCTGRHMKKRIFLQLLLDVLPFLLMIATILSQLGVSMEPRKGISAVIPCLYLFGAIPLFVLGIFMRDKMHATFGRFAWCRWLSLIFRLCSALAVAFALLLDLFLLILLIEIG